MRTLLLAVVIAAFTAEAVTHGVDCAYEYPQSSWNCLHKDHGIDFAVIRCYQSLGHVDPNCAASVKKAWAAGMKRVDLYMFPCGRCGSPAKQVTQLHDYVTSNNLKFSMMWLDIEGKQYWKSQSENRDFYNTLASTSEKLFKGKWGTYTNKNEWESVMGSWTPSKGGPLWHAYWDNKDSLAGFTPFHGWNSRVMKQYHGGMTLCSMSIDRDCY